MIPQDSKKRGKNSMLTKLTLGQINNAAAYRKNIRRFNCGNIILSVPNLAGKIPHDSAGFARLTQKEEKPHNDKLP